MQSTCCQLSAIIEEVLKMASSENKLWRSALVDNCTVNSQSELVDNPIVKCRYQSQIDAKSI